MKQFLHHMGQNKYFHRRSNRQLMSTRTALFSLLFPALLSLFSWIGLNKTEKSVSLNSEVVEVSDPPTISKQKLLNKVWGLQQAENIGFESLLSDLSAPAAPVTTSETLPAGTLIIAMDQVNQGNDRRNVLEAYGLAARLLYADIPLKLIINPNKTDRNGIDFTASARQRYPSIGTYGSRNFRTGPIAIFPGFEAEAQTVINNYGNGIRVYELQNATTVDVYDNITHKPKVNIEPTNADIHQGYLEEANLNSATYRQVGELINIDANTCVSMISVPHNDDISSAQVEGVRAFAQSGGTFFAQCAAVRGFQSGGNGSRIFPSAGFVDEPGIGNFIYSNPAEPAAQFITAMQDDGGSLENFGLPTEPPLGTRIVHDNSNVFKAYVAPIQGLTADKGGYVHFLAGHDHDSGSGGGNPDADGYYTAARYYLNAFLRPADRSAVEGCDLSIPSVAAADDTGMIDCDTDFIDIDVLANDEDLTNNPPLTIQNLTNTTPSLGTFSVVSGQVRFTPNFSGAWSGPAIATYQACNNNNFCEQATITVESTTPGQQVISGTVFEDLSSDGNLDSGEPGEGGVNVFLYEDSAPMDGTPDGPAVQTTTTDANGDYNFSLNLQFEESFSYNQRIGSGNNDADEDVGGKGDGNVDVTRDNVRMQSGRRGGFRFTGTNIPANATITSAFMYWDNDEGGKGDDGTVRIRAQDNTINAPAFSTSDFNLTNRSTTSASVDYSINWNGGETNQQTPDLSSVIQEVVNENNGANSLVFLVEGISGDEIKVVSYNASPNNAARLEINYTVTGSGPFDYLVQVDQSDLPSGTTLTTPGSQSITFTSPSVLECDVDFGFELDCPDPPDAGMNGSTAICEGTGSINLRDIITGEDIGGSWTAAPGNPSTVPISGNNANFATASPGTYTFTYTVTAPNCPSDQSVATVIVEPLPTAYTVTGGGVYCTDDVQGQVISLSDSESDVTYELFRNGVATGVTVAGTGNAISFLAQTLTGTYTVVGTRNTGQNCSQPMVGNAIISTENPPTVYNVTGGGVYCTDDVQGQVIGISDSESGVTYELFRNGSATGITVMGTGNAISFPAQTLTGTYTVIGTRNTGENCDATMNGNAVIATEDPPTIYNVTGGGVYCTDDVQAQVIGLSDSDLGVTYALFRNGIATGVTVAGTGNAVNFPPRTQTGTYTVVGTNNSGENCDATMNGNAVIATEAPPTAYNVTGGGVYCTDDVQGQVIGLSDSESGVTYELFRNGSATGITVAGTGNAINFPAQTLTGTYTVVGTNNSGENCDRTMTGNAVIATEDPPTVYNVTGGGVYCTDDVQGQVIGLSDSESGVTYELFRNGSATGITVAGTGNAINFPAQTQTGTYTVVGTNNGGENCDATMNGNATISTEDPPTVYNVTGGGAYCTNDVQGQVIGLSDSESGVTYELFRNGSATGITVAGTGNAINFPAQTQTGTYTVVGTNDSGENCDATMNGNAIISTNTPPTITVTSPANCDVSLLTYTITISVSSGTVTTSPSINSISNNGGGSYTLEANVDIDFTITVTDGNGCEAELPVMSPDCQCPTIAPPTAGPDVEYCTGSTIPMITASVPAGQTVDWYSTAAGGIPLLSGSTTFQPTMAGTYYAEARDTDTDCTSGIRTAITVTENLLPTASVSGSTAICSGDPIVNFTFMGTPDAVVTYNINGGSNTTITLNGSGTATLAASNTSSSTVNLVSVQNPSTTCTATASGSATVTVNELPTANVSGTTTICSGDPVVNFTFMGTPNALVTYTINGGSNTIIALNGAGTASLAASNTMTSTVNLVSVQNPGTNCTATVSGSATVTVNPIPTASVSPDLSEICAGQTASFTIMGTVGAQVSYTMTGQAGTQNVTIGGTGSEVVTSPNAQSDVTLDITNVSLNGCSQDPNSMATVTVKPLPTASVSPIVSAICVGETASFTISGTLGAQVSYTITGQVGTQNTTIGISGSVIITAPNAQSDVTLDITNVSLDGCSQDPDAMATVTVNPLPNPDLTVTGDDICVGETGIISIQNSEANVIYQLRLESNNNNVGAPIAGNGGTISFPPLSPTMNTQYNIFAVNTLTNCSVELTTKPIITVSATPNIGLAVSDATICEGETALIILSNSQLGVSYQLRLDDNDTPVGSPVNGNGGSRIFVVGPLTTSTTYNILATTIGTDCSVELTDKSEVTVNPTPTTTLVVSDDEVCIGDIASIVISNSEPGVRYQLRREDDDTNVGSSVLGNGGDVTINVVVSSTTTFNVFNILATDVTTSCISELADKPTVTVNPLPEDRSVTGDEICAGDQATITVLNSQNGVSYQLRRNVGDVPVGSPVVGNGNDITFNVSPSSTTVYNLLATNAENCQFELTSTATVTVNALPIQLSVTGEQICVGDNATITVENSELGVLYQLRLDDGDVNVGAPKAGTGNDLAFLVSPTTSTTYNVFAINITTNCSVELTNKAVVSVDPLPLDRNVLGDEICVGEQATITVENSELDVSYQLRRNSDAMLIGTPVVGDGNDITFMVSPTTDTDYNILATTDNNCQIELSTLASVIVNPLPNAPLIGTITQPTCTSSGSVVLNGLPAIGDWTVTVSPGGAMVMGSGTSTTVSNLSANSTYTFTVTDANGCTSVSSANAVIDPVPDIPTIGGPTTVCVGEQITVTPTSGGTWSSADDGIATVTNAGVVTGVSADQVVLTFTDGTTGCQNTVTITVEDCFVKLNLRVRLQGALLGSTDGFMRDDLRSRGLLPTLEPYSALPTYTHVGDGGGETVTDPGTVFADLGNQSIIDWVFVELRSAADPTIVVETASGLLQKDGDVVDVDGVSPLCFTQSQPGDYYVAVHHRNHLATMTASAITMTAQGTLVDMIDVNTPLWHNQANYDGLEQITIAGQYAMWCSNTNFDDRVVFAGQDNDVDPIFNAIDLAPGNQTFRSQGYVYTIYHEADVNMDGDVIFAGQNNDVDHVFNSMDLHPLNALFRSQGFVFLEQLAK